MSGASSGGYLPPVVATLAAEAADFFARIEEAKLALEDLTKTPTDVQITADGAAAVAAAEATRAAMNAATMPPITFTIAINTMEALAELAAIRALAGIVAEPITIPVTANIAPLVADMAVARAAAEAQGGSNGVLGRLLWGAGGIAGFAAFGSLASLAGLGFEHVLTTAIGLAGSLAGAIGGGLLLAIGSVGVALVGMGSDLLVMRGAAADVTKYQNALDRLTRAIAIYGAGSTQAKAAQYDLNQVTQDWSAALLASVKATAAAKDALTTLWTQVSSTATIAANSIMQQVYQLGTVYAPLVANAAATNLTIINTSIKPLFAWLSTTGVQIFRNLETVFARNLPTAIHAFTQGVELVLKTINFMSGYTGGLTKAIDTLLTKANSPGGFAHWESIMLTLIDIFHTWWNFLKLLGRTIFDLFSQSAGLGTSIVQTITQMLTHLDAWLKSVSGKNAVHNLFAVHLQEVQALLGLLPGLLSAFGQLYLTIAPPLTLLVAGLATMVGWMVKIPVVGPLLGWAAAIWLLASRLKLLAIMGAIGAAFEVFGALASGASVGIGALTVGVDGLAIGAWALTGPIAIIIGALAILAGGIVLLVLHFQQVSSFLSGPWGTAISGATAVLMPFIGIPMLIIGHWQAIWSFLHSIPGRFADAWRAVIATGPTILNWFRALPSTIMNFLKSLPGLLVKWAGDALGAGVGLLKGLIGALPNILKFFIELPFKILALLVGAVAFLLLWGFQIIKNLLGGIAQGAVAVWNWFRSLPGTILRFLTGLPTLLLSAGSGLLHGMWTGIVAAAPAVWSFLGNMPTMILNILSGLGHLLFDVGRAILGGLWDGLKSMWNDMTGWISNLAGWISHLKGPLEQDAVLLIPHGRAIMAGLNAGLLSGWGNVQQTLRGVTMAMGAPTVLHSITASSNSAPMLSGAGGGGNQQVSVSGISVTVQVPPGTPSQVAQQVGGLTEQAVNQSIYKAVRQMRGGARTYGFMPG
jgi:hypothetical protein